LEFFECIQKTGLPVPCLGGLVLDGVATHTIHEIDIRSVTQVDAVDVDSMQ
jgi:hypothetical protein